ncbi:MAG: hypothetical protein INQ03_17560 [Candidatus Heimdallarchaeota archaeon]|nr:hypothetical protein [Candidatus Heimdallarchaeota archaeon]
MDWIELDKKVKNCWEIMNCNCEKDTSCPATKHSIADGFLGGSNGGTSCMFIKYTTMVRNKSDRHLSVPAKIMTYCNDCEYYRYLKEELDYISYADYLKYTMAK